MITLTQWILNVNIKISWGDFTVEVHYNDFCNRKIF